MVLRTVALLAGLGLALRTRAADAPPPAPAPGGIDAAKTQYDAIKTARSGQEQQKLAVPTVPPLDLKLDDIPFAPAALNPNSHDPSKSANSRKSQNWLLDAMEAAKKKAARRDGESKDASKSFDELDAATGDEPSATASKLDLAVESSKDSRDNRKLGQAAPDVVNPLASYMSSWLSAGDLALLNLKSNSAADALSAPGASGQPAAPTSGWDPAAPLFDASGKSDRSAPPTNDETNPYLTPLALSPPPPLTLPSSVPAPPALIPAPTPLPTPDPVRTPSPAEQFRNSRDDDKLFKPLKRF